jgi:hypothetical protein
VAGRPHDRGRGPPAAAPLDADDGDADEQQPPDRSARDQLEAAGAPEEHGEHEHRALVPRPRPQQPPHGAEGDQEIQDRGELAARADGAQHLAPGLVDALPQKGDRRGRRCLRHALRQPRGGPQLVGVARRVAELEGAVVIRGLLLQVGLEAAGEVVDVLGVEVVEARAHSGSERGDAAVEGGICGVHGLSPIVRTFTGAGAGPSPVSRVRWVRAGDGSPRSPLMAVAKAAQVTRWPASSSRPSGLIA